MNARTLALIVLVALGACAPALIVIDAETLTLTRASCPVATWEAAQ